ncbi:MAG: hypothetical protein M9936_23170 [Caldilinea sp.]|nr:hypothetical protein [Caldilinea sp.]
MKDRSFVRRPLAGVAVLLLAALLAACSALPATAPAPAVPAAESAAADPAADTAEPAVSEVAPEETAAESGRPAGWRDASHSNDVDPTYAVVFPQDRVNEITITIAPDDWEAMQADMVELYGEPGTRGGPGGMMPPGGAPPEGFQPPALGERPAGMAPRRDARRRPWRLHDGESHVGAGHHRIRRQYLDPCRRAL